MAPGCIFGYAGDFLGCRNHLCFVIQGAWGAPQVIAAKSWIPELRKWHHVALVKNAGQASFVRDGVLDAQAVISEIPAVKAPLTFGMSAGEYALRGGLDEVRVWNLARRAEVMRLAMFKQLTGKENGLVAYWRLDESRGTIANDMLNPARPARVRGTIPVIQTDKAPASVGQIFINSIGMHLAYIPSGRYPQTPATRRSTTRSTAQNRSRKPAGPLVEIRPCFLGECEVTVGQFSQFVKASGYVTQAEKSGGMPILDPAVGDAHDEPKANWRNPGVPQSEVHPVVGVSWIDANEFCKWLSRREHRTYRLPRDVEWEYACRADVFMKYWWGMAANGIQASYANGVDLSYKEKFPVKARCTWRDGFTFTAPVGSFMPNRWGLYDMSGNVDEWCADDPDFTAPTANASVPKAANEVRALRGGGWASVEGRFYVKNRRRLPVDYRNNSIGFRVLLESDAEQ
jgi:formylglycine-generating enzyme required for sulfatase activity